MVATTSTRIVRSGCTRKVSRSSVPRSAAWRSSTIQTTGWAAARRRPGRPARAPTGETPGRRCAAGRLSGCWPGSRSRPDASMPSVRRQGHTREIRRRVRELPGPPPGHPQPGRLGLGGERRRQRALADARVARDQHELTTPLLRRRQGGAQALQRAFAAVEGGAGHRSRLAVFGRATTPRRESNILRACRPACSRSWGSRSVSAPRWRSRRCRWRWRRARWSACWGPTAPARARPCG